MCYMLWVVYYVNELVLVWSVWWISIFISFPGSLYSVYFINVILMFWLLLLLSYFLFQTCIQFICSLSIFSHFPNWTFHPTTLVRSTSCSRFTHIRVSERSKKKKHQKIMWWNANTMVDSIFFKCSFCCGSYVWCKEHFPFSV